MFGRDTVLGIPLRIHSQAVMIVSDPVKYVPELLLTSPVITIDESHS